MKCPNCEHGYLRPTGKSYGGYPADECDRCNTFSLNPVEGREKPFRRLLRALHEAGCEPGTDPDCNARSELLRLAESHVNGDRNSQYGDPNQDFARTAAMWSAYLGIEVKPHDVAAMMCLLKVSRIRWSPSKQDSWTDLAGYAACGWDCAKDTTSGTSPPTQPQREPPPDKMQRGV